MSEFNVIIKNTIAEGFSHQEVQENLARYLKISPDKFAQLLTRKATVVKKGISSENAEKFRKILVKCGIEHEIQASSSSVNHEPQPEKENLPTTESTTLLPPAPQTTPAESVKTKPGLFERIPSEKRYSDIPFYRKPLTLILSFLFFSPATLIICLTGDTYSQNKGVVYQAPRGMRWLLILMSALYLAKGIAFALK